MRSVRRWQIFLQINTFLLFGCSQSSAGPTAKSSQTAQSQAGGAAEDRVVPIAEKQRKEMERFIKQARDSLPAVKARFLKGLGPGQRLFVTIALRDPGGAVEQVFAKVLAWEGDVIQANISSEVQTLKTHRAGESITLSAEQIMDWTITLPDGREEGNFVGKYLDSVNGGAQPEPPAIPIGAWITLSHPSQGTFLLFTYVDSRAGFSAKGDKLSSAMTRQEVTGAVEHPTTTFRLPMPGFQPAALSPEMTRRLSLPSKPAWMKYYEH